MAETSSDGCSAFWDEIVQRPRPCGGSIIAWSYDAGWLTVALSRTHDAATVRELTSMVLPACYINLVAANCRFKASILKG